jgi:hypothetical protein
VLSCTVVHRVKDPFFNANVFCAIAQRPATHPLSSCTMVQWATTTNPLEDWALHRGASTTTTTTP